MTRKGRFVFRRRHCAAVARTGEGMRSILVGLLTVAATLTSSAQAEPVHLTCGGEWHANNLNGAVTKQIDLSLAVDMKAPSVTVLDGYEPVPIRGVTDRESVIFAADPGKNTGVLAGTINRETGAVEFTAMSPDGPRAFKGTCKLAHWLF